ncbi:uncharacterized protein LOC126901073 isoform X2 [Daktulosphaira vitifoliae]|uniref:uncharacterized protein LOC126901073 isoform X2 n=1 Tax=Daktulosphaira vitifoliae TaxID=58002 RepID=UPI0021AAF194|nr:uncharacterized protein LOC126901073 isoform X2 [Daktulosphaira vitifoliae]
MSTVTSVIGPELYEVQEIRRLYDLFDVQRVEKINNPLLYGMYTLRKNEMEYNNPTVPVNEWLLYHATAITNLQSILENNLDWRLTCRSRYGKGVCFSYCPLYANKYASCSIEQSEDFIFDDYLMNLLLEMGFPREAVKKALFYTQNSSLELATQWLMNHIIEDNFAEPFSSIINDMSVERIFIICNVLIQRIKEVSVNYNLKVLPNFFDTAISRNKMVYVKFMDYEFYPRYIVYYKNHSYNKIN